MPKKAKESKYEEEGWQGGAKIDLDKSVSGGITLRDKLSTDVGTWLNQELENQQERIDKIIEWEKQYKGVRSPKSYPHTMAANCAIPFTRSMVDTIYVRVVDAIYGKKKMWIVEPQEPEFAEIAPQIEKALDWWQREVVHLKDKMAPAMQQSLKTGTGLLKMSYKKKKRTVCRYATEQDKIEGKKLYKTGKDPIVKETVTEFDGPDIDPISREDAFVSTDSTGIQDAFMVGFRTYMRKPEVDAKVKAGQFDEGIAEKIFGVYDTDDVKKERAANQKLEIKDFDREKLKIWEVYLRYDIDDDDEEDDIVLWIHEETKEILGAIYNPSFYGFRPFISLIPNPYEYRFDGEGVVEILESIQREIDTLHNLRIDRLHAINAPPKVVSESSIIDETDIEDIYPNKVIRVNSNTPKDAIVELKSTDVLPSTWQEEAVLEKYGREAVGVTPQVMGQNTAERPVAKETYALIQEANKKFMFIIDNYRKAHNEVGMMGLELIAQHAPRYTYYEYDEMGNKVEKALTLTPNKYLRDGLKIKLSVSSEVLNQEVRREIWLYVWTLLSDMYTKNAGILQAISQPGLPDDVKRYFLQVLNVSLVLIKNILEDFNIIDPDTYIKTPDGQAMERVIQESNMIQQMQQQMAQMQKYIQQLESQVKQAPQLPQQATQ